MPHAARKGRPRIESQRLLPALDQRIHSPPLSPSTLHFSRRALTSGSKSPALMTSVRVLSSAALDTSHAPSDQCARRAVSSRSKRATQAARSDSSSPMARMAMRRMRAAALERWEAESGRRKGNGQQGRHVAVHSDAQGIQKLLRSPSSSDSQKTTAPSAVLYAARRAARSCHC